MANSTRRVSELLKTGFINIDSYEEKCFKGRVFYPAFEGEVKFANAMQMLAAISKAINELGYTDEYCKMRSFAPSPVGTQEKSGAASSVQTPKGELATFKIKVIFMQNATWQGTINWEESGEEQNFRSVFEMLNLMDSALTHCLSS